MMSSHGTNTQKGFGDIRKELLSIGLITLTFILMAWLSWMKWTDAIIDFGSELYVPWQLQQGAVLYKDLASFKGPFSPYLNLLWFDLFGASLRTLVWANLTILAVLTSTLTLVVRRCTDRLTATLAAVVFLTEFGFAALVGNNFNYVTPMVHELTHGLTLSFLLMLCLHRLSIRSSAIVASVSGLLLGCILLTRMEVGIAATGAIIIFTLLLFRNNPRDVPSSLRTLLTILGTTTLPPLFAFLLLSRQMPWPDALNGMLGTWKIAWTTPVTSTYLFEHNAGFHMPVKFFLETLVSALFVLNWILAIFFLERMTKPSLPQRDWMLSAGIVLALSCGIAVNPLPPLMGGRPLPVIAGLFFLFAFLRACNRKTDDSSRSRWVICAIFSAYACIFLGKILLNARVRHYGFAHAMPAMLVAVMTLVWLIPVLLREHGYLSRIFRILAISAILFDILYMLKTSAINYQNKTTPVGEGKDTFLVFNASMTPQAKMMNDLLSAIHTHVPEDATLTPVPEGLMINFLVRRRSPIPVLNFMMTEMAIFGEANILRSFEANPPDFIALTQRNTEDFGFLHFGSDPAYGKSILDWIDGHYRKIWSEGDDPRTSTIFSAELLERIK